MTSSTGVVEQPMATALSSADIQDINDTIPDTASGIKGSAIIQPDVIEAPIGISPNDDGEEWEGLGIGERPDTVSEDKRSDRGSNSKPRSGPPRRKGAFKTLILKTSGESFKDAPISSASY